ncbi:hypothetical protein GCM10027403_24060 [Arthrobacter tecti]
MDPHQILERGGVQQGHIAVGDDDCPFDPVPGVEDFEGNLHRTSGAGHLILVHDERSRIQFQDVRSHTVTLVADDYGELPRREATGCRQCVPNHGCAADAVEDFRGPGFHPCPGSGCQNYHCCRR